MVLETIKDFGISFGALMQWIYNHFEKTKKLMNMLDSKILKLTLTEEKNSSTNLDQKNPFTPPSMHKHWEKVKISPDAAPTNRTTLRRTGSRKPFYCANA